MRDHHYSTTIAWTGSTASGYAAYHREHDVQMSEEVVTLSADAAFRGDSSLPNPEQLLLAAASSCQLLSFLAVASLAGVDVVSYQDDATATMPADAVPARITRIDLAPRIGVRGAAPEDVLRLVGEAHDGCYIANSVSAEVIVTPTIEVLP